MGEIAAQRELVCQEDVLGEDINLSFTITSRLDYMTAKFLSNSVSGIL